MPDNSKLGEIAIKFEKQPDVILNMGQQWILIDISTTPSTRLHGLETMAYPALSPIITPICMKSRSSINELS